jgi:LysR family glycine cleavage system transcriptional activator
MSDPIASTPLSAIRIFEAAARLKSFTRAADELGVSQAAVSWQVKALEQRLGLPLFLRLAREVALTPAGERLARASSEAISVLRAALSDITETAEGVLAITTLQSLATQWLAPRLGGFQIAHPKLAVRLDTSTRLVDLSRENIDVSIRSGVGEWPGMTAHFLFPSLVTPLVAPALGARLEGPRSLLSEPLIGLPEEWAAWFVAAGVTDAPLPGGPRMVADLQTIEMASALAGQGAALGSPIYFAGEIAAGRLVQPFETVIPQSAGVWLAYPSERRRSPKIAAFRDWLMGIVDTDPVVARFAKP